MPATQGRASTCMSYWEKKEAISKVWERPPLVSDTKQTEEHGQHQTASAHTAQAHPEQESTKNCIPSDTKFTDRLRDCSLAGLLNFILSS